MMRAQVEHVAFRECERCHGVDLRTSRYVECAIRGSTATQWDTLARRSLARCGLSLVEIWSFHKPLPTRARSQARHFEVLSTMYHDRRNQLEASHTNWSRRWYL